MDRYNIFIGESSVSLSNQPDWNNVALAISSLLVSISSVVISSYLVMKHRRELSLSEQISNAPDFIYKEYINRDLERPITIDGRKCTTLREARNAFTDRLKNSGQKEQLADNDAWKDFAYQLSIALENLGLLVLAGAVPIKLVFPNVAGLIVEDWNRCHEVVGTRRTKPITLKTSKQLTEPISFQRRHAEWLAIAAKIYLRNHWEGEGVEELLKHSENFKNLEKRERELREAEKKLVLAKTSKEIADFLYA